MTDDTEAIMNALDQGHRCRKDCNATSSMGQIVYFPPGTYLISEPIIQYYYTIFTGHPKERATIKGAKNFKGIALVDTNPYYVDRVGPDGKTGVNW